VHYLDESHIQLFLVQLLLLLAVARTLGVACQRVKIPALAGEILTGVVLGPTLLGRISPELQSALFPVEVIQMAMLDTVSWLGVFFLLLSVGFEVDVSRAVFRQGKKALSVGIVGVLVPIAVGFPVFWFLDDAYHGPKATHLGFTLFLSVAGSITAISVIARVLRDLEIVKTDVGTLILSACAVNDVFGWILFTFVVALATGGTMDPVRGVAALVGVVIFVAICLTVGSYVLRRAAKRVKATKLPDTPALLTLITSVGLLCGSATHALGIHAILGFFLAGVMVGSIEEEITFDQRQALADTVHAVFVPIFFATIGIKIDFLAHLDLTITCLFTIVAIGGKLFGAWLGARAVSIPNRASVFIGSAFTPGGAMEIVVGILALELGLVSQVTFVGIVFAALLSSITVGPLLAWLLRAYGPDVLALPGGPEAPEQEASP